LWGQPGVQNASRFKILAPIDIYSIEGWSNNFPGYYVPGINFIFHIWQDDGTGLPLEPPIYSSAPLDASEDSGWNVMETTGSPLFHIDTPNDYHFGYELTGDSATAFTLCTSDTLSNCDDPDDVSSSYDWTTSWWYNVEDFGIGGIRWDIYATGEYTECVDEMVIPTGIIGPRGSPIHVPVYGWVCGDPDHLDGISFSLCFDTTYLQVDTILYQVSGLDNMGNNYATLYDIIPSPGGWYPYWDNNSGRVLVGLVGSFGGIPDWPQGIYRFFDIVFNVDSQSPVDYYHPLYFCPNDRGINSNWTYVTEAVWPILENGSIYVPSGLQFIRGDVAPPGAQDGSCTMADGLMILGYYYGETGLDCMDAGDVDDNGEVTMGDGLRALGYYFGDLASAPEPPFPDCGPDPTSDELDCVFHQYCVGKAVAAKPWVSVNGAPNNIVLNEAVAEDGIMRVPVDLVITEDMLGCAFLVDYDASKLSFSGLAGGEGYDFYRYHVVDEAKGLVRVGCIPDLELKDVFVAGEHRVAELEFKVNGSAIGELGLDEVEVVNRSFLNVPVEWVVKTGVDNLPTEFALGQNYPNPFNPTTLIRYALPAVSDQSLAVRLEIYNILGEKVVTLVDEKQTPGYKVVTWDAKDLASGIYFYRLEAGEFTAIRKMVLLK